MELVRRLSSKRNKQSVSPARVEDVVFEMHNTRRLNNIVELLRKDADENNVNKAYMFERINRDIYQPLKDGNHLQRVKFSDNLADINGVRHLTQFLHKLRIDCHDDRPIIHLVLKLFKHCADVNAKIQMEIGKCGLLLHLLYNLQSFFPISPGDKSCSKILRCAVSILYSCTKIQENLHIYRDLDAIHLVLPCLTEEDRVVGIFAVCIICNVTANKQDWEQINVTDTIVQALLDVLKAALRAEKLRARVHKTTWSASEMTSVLRSLAINSENRRLLHQADVISLMTSLIKIGSTVDQLCAVNALETLLTPSSDITENVKEDDPLTEALQTLCENEDSKLREVAGRVLKVLDIDQKVTVEAPSEITTLGEQAERAYRRALRKGCVRVDRARIMIIGDDQVGKTSLKNSLLGIPFNPEQQSTVGIDVDPSLFQIDVDDVKNWKKIGEDSSKLGLVPSVAGLVLESMKNQSQSTESVDSEVTTTPTKDETSTSSEVNQSQYADLNTTADNSDESSYGSDDDESFSHPECTECSDVISGLYEMGDCIPRDVLDHVVKCMRELDLSTCSTQTEATPVLSIWDFAGQHLYYSSHLPFFSPRAIYLLCYSLEKDLSAPAKPSVRQGTATYVLDKNCKKTNLDVLHSWLISVHSVSGAPRSPDESPSCDVKGSFNYCCPPVVLVGTHVDRACADPQKIEEAIKASLKGKEYKKHLTYPFFRVDNTKEIPNFEVELLQKRISELLNNEAWVSQSVPVRWFQFERVIEEFTKKEVYFLNLETVNRIARDVCFIKDEIELQSMLTFYHSLGLIVKHGGTVVLKAQWLISLFSTLITVRPFGEQNPELVHYWEKLEDTGILDTRLVDHVFGQLNTKGEYREDLLAMMESFGLIAGFEQTEVSPEGEKRLSKSYLVPAQLSSLPSDVQNEYDQSDLCSLYFAFSDGFLPNGIFHRFICCCIQRCAALGCTEEPNLFKNGVRFLALGPSDEYDLLLIEGKYFIKVSLVYVGSDSKPKAHDRNKGDFVYQARHFIVEVLKDSLQMSGSDFRLPFTECVACSSCLTSNRKCVKHQIESCRDDDCIHLITVPSKQPLICKNTFGKGSRPVIPGLERWFPERKQCSVNDCSTLPEHAQVKDGCPTTKQLNELAAELSTTWKMVGRALDLEESLLDSIKEENQGKIHEQCFAMLNSWKQMKGQNATYTSLYFALKDKPVSRPDLAAKYCCETAMRLNMC